MPLFIFLITVQGLSGKKYKQIFMAPLCPKQNSPPCTLIYYPKEKLSLIRKDHKDTAQWYKNTLNQFVEIARFLSSKYTRSKVRKAIPAYTFIIDELIHAQPDEDNNQVVYHASILDSIIDRQLMISFVLLLL